MAQAFVSTYRNHYRGIPQKKVPSINPDIVNKLPDDDKNLWIISEDTYEDSENLAKAYAKIKELERKRNRSVYQVTYCRDLDQHKVIEQDEDLEDQIILYCRKLYERKIEKMLPPLPSSRNINGYLRRARLITPLSVYQHEYGRLACSILEKRDY